jgi:hypothetical protein
MTDTELLREAAKYLRDKHGRLATGRVRRILTTLAQSLDKDLPIDLNSDYIRKGYKGPKDSATSKIETLDLVLPSFLFIENSPN